MRNYLLSVCDVFFAYPIIIKLAMKVLWFLKEEQGLPNRDEWWTCGQNLFYNKF